MLPSTLAEGNVSYQVIGTEKLKCVLIHYKSSGPQSEALHSGWQIQPKASWGGRDKNNDLVYNLSLWFYFMTWSVFNVLYDIFEYKNSPILTQ